jgi:hypothetical protein
MAYIELTNSSVLDKHFYQFRDQPDSNVDAIAKNSGYFGTSV